ncbi:MAG TPA: periplasmic heavy metal sensor [Candidatus Melainabacteria bacterium]|nr:periplasmic heavy metal sensor [Candidatus Melainabacteria bacterium]
MNWKFTVALLLSFGWALPCLAAGSQVAYRGDGERQGKRGSLLYRTNLDDAQLEALVARKNQYEADTASDRAQMQVHYRKLFFLLSKPGVDRKDVLAEQEKISELNARLFKTRITYFMDAWSLLNEEQRQKMRRMVLERQLSSRSWRGRGQDSGTGSRYRSGADRVSNSSDSAGEKDAVSKSSSESASGSTQLSSSSSLLPTAEEYLLMLAAEED